MPTTRTGATSITENPNLDTTSKNIMAAKEDEPTLQAIFNMVKNTNDTVTTMEIRLKRLKEDGTPEIKKLSELTTSVNSYTDQIGELENTVKDQKVTIKQLIGHGNICICLGSCSVVCHLHFSGHSPEMSSIS